MTRILLIVFGALSLLVLIFTAYVGNRLHRGKTSISINTHLTLAKIGLSLILLHAAAVICFLYF